MRFVFTIGRMTVFDFSLFRYEEVNLADNADVVVVHHYTDDEDEEKNDGPGDIFGSKG